MNYRESIHVFVFFFPYRRGKPVLECFYRGWIAAGETMGSHYSIEATTTEKQFGHTIDEAPTLCH